MINIKNISYKYTVKNVIDNVTLTFESGQNYSIIGPNGCGKTTLLKSIAGLIKCDGEIFIDDINITNYKQTELAKKIAILNQNNDVYFPYTVFDTVMLGRFSHIKKTLFSSPSKTDYDIVNKYLSLLNLQDIKNKNIQQLSGGQRQLVFLAKTLAQEPSIILLDEPTNHLDIAHQLTLINYLKEWSSSKNNSVIGVFHDINMATHFTKNLVLMSNGKVSATGNFYDITKNDSLNTVYDTDVVNFMKNSLDKWSMII